MGNAAVVMKGNTMEGVGLNSEQTRERRNEGGLPRKMVVPVSGTEFCF